MEQKYKYSLEPYSTSRKYDSCPKCKQQRYVHYIDTETGEQLPYEYGRCERTNNCGYHKSSKEFINNLKVNKMDNKPKQQICEVYEDRYSQNLMFMGEESYNSGALSFYLMQFWDKSTLYAVLKEYRIMRSEEHTSEL